MNYILCISIICISVVVVIVCCSTKIETFQNPTVKENILLHKCFDPTDINSFTKYYDKTNIINIQNSVVFSTPNQLISEIPHITWNGVFLNNLCVDPQMRNKGIGTQLVRRVIEQARKAGKDHVMLQVADSNISAINIYKKLGFTIHTQGMNDKGESISIYIYKI